jgi:hypothetical protein
MSPYLKSVLTVAFNLAIAVGLNWVTKGAVNVVAFVAGSALWWGARAYYLAEVNTAHKNSEVQ